MVHFNKWMAFLLAMLCSGAAASKSAAKEEEKNDTSQRPPLDPSKTYYLKRADQFYVASQSALNLHNALPLGWYTVGWNQMLSEYYLKQIFPFDLKEKKLYGDTEMQAQRILQTFRARAGKPTGVLLAGQKGSGKTLLAKHISVRAAEELGVSTIVINEPWSGERFNAFIQSIQQPTIVLFDEFEKVYRQSAETEAKEQDKQLERRMRYGLQEEFMSGEDRISNPSQDAILTLLDGVYPSNMLFLFTVNEKSKISKHMMNRPGRIYYVLDFSGLESNFIRDYCEDTLRNKTYISDIVSYASLFEAFSFDMLQALVQEMNLYGESPENATHWLNIRMELGEQRVDTYLIRQLLVDGNDITKKIHRTTWRGNPAVSDFVEIHVYSQGWMGGKSWSVQFSPQNHLISGNLTSGEYVLEDEVRRNKAVLMRSRRTTLAAMSRILVT